MWNADFETRMRDLDAQASDRVSRLLDTMTETDGSAKSSRLALTHIIERIKQAFASTNRSADPMTSYRGPVTSGK